MADIGKAGILYTSHLPKDKQSRAFSSPHKTIIVPDVDAFPGHIACSSLTKSEIVVPIINKGVVAAVLDIDSEKADNFDDTDKFYLEKIAALFA